MMANFLYIPWMAFLLAMVFVFVSKKSAGQLHIKEGIFLLQNLYQSEPSPYPFIMIWEKKRLTTWWKI